MPILIVGVLRRDLREVKEGAPLSREQNFLSFLHDALFPSVDLLSVV